MSNRVIGWMSADMVKRSRKAYGVDEVWQRMTTDVVREMGLEPTRPKTQEPKSCAATITPLARIAGRGRNRNRRLCKTLGRGCAAPRAVEPLDRIELSTCSLRVSRSTD